MMGATRATWLLGALLLEAPAYSFCSPSAQQPAAGAGAAGAGSVPAFGGACGAAAGGGTCQGLCFRCDKQLLC